MNATTKAIIAYLAICIIWGSTYLGIRLAIEAFPPFLMAGFRQFVAGIFLLLLALSLKRKINHSLKNISRQCFIGFLLITVGNGLVTWAEKYIPSGVAALVCSTMPIGTVVINITKGNESFQWKTFIGMALGFLGVFLVFYESLNASVLNVSKGYFYLGLLALITATLSWAWGSILNKEDADSGDGLSNAGLQVLFGGCFMLLLSPVLDAYDTLVWDNTAAWLALSYLIIFGSVVAYTAYMYALKVLPVGFVTSYAYFNPIVAILLGTLILNEPFSSTTLIAIFLIISGVFIVKNAYKKKTLKSEH